MQKKQTGEINMGKARSVNSSIKFIFLAFVLIFSFFSFSLGSAYNFEESSEGTFNFPQDNLDGHLASFFMPLNNSVYGNFNFNGGWESGGFSIIDGDIYAQTGFFYNITGLNVTKVNLTVLDDLIVSGRVGIGTSSPTRKLHVVGADAAVLFEGSGTDVQVVNTDNSAIFTIGTNAAGGFVQGKDAGGSEGFIIRSYASSGIQAYFTKGNVGIGTNSPSDLLDLSAAVPILRFTDGTGYGRIYSSAGSLILDADKGKDGASSTMAFTVDSSTKMTIDTTGFVGIGTTSPDVKLHLKETSGDVEMTMESVTGNVFTYQKAGTDEGGAEAILNYLVQGSTRKWYYGMDTGSDFVVHDLVRGQNAIEIKDNGDMFLMQGGGNVGIGTTTPASFLAGVPGLAIYDATASGISLAKSGKYWLNWIQSDGDLAWYSQEGATERMVLQDTTGNLGIGTTSPQSILNINGTLGSLAGGLSFGDGDTGIYENTDDNLYFKFGATTPVRMSATGLLSIATTGAQLQFAGVSSTAPSLIPRRSDSNTGIGSATDDELTLITGGAERIRIDSSGNVGIGTAAPDVAMAGNIILTVGGTTASDRGGVEILGSNAAGGQAIADLGFTNDASDDADERIALIQALTDGAKDEGRLDFFTHTGSALGRAMTILSDQNVGIGTTTPKELLQIGDTMVISDTYKSLNFNTYFDGSNYRYLTNDEVAIIQFSSGDMNFRTAPSGTAGNVATLSSRFFIENAGNVGIGTVNPTSKLYVDATTDYNTDSPVVFFYNPEAAGHANGLLVKAGADFAGDYSFQVQDASGNTDLYIEGTGNVGIGTTTPQSILHLSDDSNIILTFNRTNVANSWDFRTISTAFALKSSDSETAKYYVSSDGRTSIGNQVTNAMLNVQTVSTRDILNLLETGGVEVFTVLESGNVGIGNTSPSATLHVSENDAQDVFRIDDITGDTSPFLINQFGRVGIRTTTNMNGPLTLKVESTAITQGLAFQDWDSILNYGLISLDSNDNLAFGSYNGSAFVTNVVIDNGNGNVGIGTVAPTHELNVVGDLNVTGIIYNPAIYCESSELVDQNFPVAGVRYRLNISNVDEGNGITMSTGNNGTNITIDTLGVYHLVAQPQVKAGAGGAGDFHMWIEKFNSTGWFDIPDSNIELKLSSLEEDVIVLATTLKLNQGEKLRLVASVSDNKILLHAQSPAGEPVIPSIIFTMYRIGS